MSDDELFNYVMGQIRVGREYERYVAGQLIAAGIPAVVGQDGVVETRTEQEWREFEDERDILVAGRWRLEVKSRTFSFTSVADHPFDSTIVSTVRSWENKVEKPIAVAIVSQSTKAIVVVPASTRSYWKKRERPDRKRGYPVLNYECPVALLRPWEELVAWFKQRLVSPETDAAAGAANPCPDCGSEEVWITETDDLGRCWYHCPECGRQWKGDE